MTEETSAPEEALPFVAPCREIAATAPFAWLRRGWTDMWSAPRQSLTYGTIVILLSLALAWVAVKFGGYWEEYDLWSEEFIAGETLDRVVSRPPCLFRKSGASASIPIPVSRQPRGGNEADPLQGNTTGIL